MVNLSTFYNGTGLRWQRQTTLAGQPFTLSAGAELDSMDQRRRGYVNNNGEQGALRRDENDTVSSTGAYAQAEWQPAERWMATAGIRRTSIAVDFADHFIVPGNGDDSGKPALPGHHAGREPALPGHGRAEPLRQRRPGLRDADAGGDGL